MEQRLRSFTLSSCSQSSCSQSSSSLIFSLLLSTLSQFILIPLHQVVDGVQTLLFESVVQMKKQAPELFEKTSSARLNNIFIQVGGGALGSGLVHAARALENVGIFSKMPRFEAVQASGNPPVVNAMRKIRERGVTEIRQAVMEREVGMLGEMW